jgi:hypothetical protein
LGDSCATADDCSLANRAAEKLAARDPIDTGPGGLCAGLAERAANELRARQYEEQLGMLENNFDRCHMDITDDGGDPMSAQVCRAAARFVNQWPRTFFFRRGLAIVQDEMHAGAGHFCGDRNARCVESALVERARVPVESDKPWHDACATDEDLQAVKYMCDDDIAMACAEESLLPRDASEHVDALRLAERDLPCDLQLNQEQKLDLDKVAALVRDCTGPSEAMKVLVRDLAVRATMTASMPSLTSSIDVDVQALDSAMNRMLHDHELALATLRGECTCEALPDSCDYRSCRQCLLADALKRESGVHETGAARHEASATGWNARRLDRITTDLGLDTNQKKKVEDMLATQPDPAAPRDEMNRRTDEIVAAIRADASDAQSVVQAAHFTARLLRLLGPDQLAKFVVLTTGSAAQGCPGEWWFDEGDGRDGGAEDGGADGADGGRSGAATGGGDAGHKR